LTTSNHDDAATILEKLAEGIRFDSDGFDSDGLCSRRYDRDGFYLNGWSIDGRNRVTGSRFDANGWSQEHIHAETKTRLNLEGLSWSETLPHRDAQGFDYYGRDCHGLTVRGFSRLDIHFETHTEFDSNGFNSEGFDAEGADENGFYSYEAADELMGLNRFTSTQ
jgi:hypothetical protein